MQRVAHAAAFLLHQHPWGDRGRIFELFSREHGRLRCLRRACAVPRRSWPACCNPSCRCWFPGPGGARRHA
ncbi:MAG: recombination protein O N-terminal domain-containing protein [Proteobacteria bacterium]|nr:recombination protein O N-terminal domain-containing protein [Pseudomonadota bacterium]